MQKILFHVFAVVLMLSATTYANSAVREIPLYEVGSSKFMPTDSPDQSSDDPPRPNQFHAYISGPTLIFQIANTNLNHVMVHDTTGNVMLNVHFVGDTTFLLPTLGHHVVEIQNGSLRLIGEFDREMERTRTDSVESMPAGDPNNPPEPVYLLDYTITTMTDCYIIDVTYPEFYLNQVFFPDDGVTYVEVHYPGYGVVNPFDYGIVNGQPQLLFLSLNLQIPDGATFHTSIDNIEYYNDIYLSNLYLPAQNILENAEDVELQLDENYYAGYLNNVWLSPVEVSDPYYSRGTTGITVHLFPFMYYPNLNTLRPIRKIRYVICFSGDEALLDMYERIIDDEKLVDVTRFYDTYAGIDTLLHPDYKGNYLILTTEEYEDGAELYAQHKENVGFNVQVETLTNNMLDSSYIRNYLKTLYNYEDYRPRFVLLIGSDIPYSYGEMDNEDNPPTDMYYACVDSYYVENEDITPDMYVGRWAVNNTTELMSVIEKSITYDLSVPNRRIALFSGTDGDSWYMEYSFENANKAIYNLVIDQVQSISAVNYIGSCGFDDTHMRTEFEHHDNLMCIYFGHGFSQNFGEPYNAINIYNLPNNLPYFTFAFACAMNNPHNFGTVWLNNGDRSCTFYGATTAAMLSETKELQKSIFGNLKEHKNITIGELVYNGVSRANGNRVPKSGLCAYVFNGDPSLYIYGMGINGNPVQYGPEQAESECEKNQVESTETNIDYSIYTISGVLIYSQSVDVNHMMSDIHAHDLQDGLYILTTQTEHNAISTEKIIIQH